MQHMRNKATFFTLLLSSYFLLAAAPQYVGQQQIRLTTQSYKSAQVKQHMFVIVGSYEPTNPCGSQQIKGIIKGIADDPQLKDQKVSIKIFYLLSRSRNTSYYDLNIASQKILLEIAALHPDVIFVTDDSAFTNIGIPLLLNNENVVFSGTNIPLKVYFKRYTDLIQIKNKLRGVTEQIDFQKLKDFFQSVGYNLNKIHIITDSINIFSYYVYRSISKVFNNVNIDQSVVDNLVALQQDIQTSKVTRTTCVFLFVFALKETNDYYEISSIAKLHNTHSGLIVGISDQILKNCDMIVTTNFEKMGYDAYYISKNQNPVIKNADTIIIVNENSEILSRYIPICKNIKDVRIERP